MCPLRWSRTLKQIDVTRSHRVTGHPSEDLHFYLSAKPDKANDLHQLDRLRFLERKKCKTLRSIQTHAEDGITRDEVPSTEKMDFSSSSPSRSSRLTTTPSHFAYTSSTGGEDTRILSESSSLLGRSSALPSTTRRSSAMATFRRSKASRFLDKIAVAEAAPRLTDGQLMLANHDLKPVEPARRVWRGRNFVAFWISDSFNINTWMIASSNIVAGMSWWQSWLTVWIGYTIAAFFVCLTGRIASKYHIAFPVVARSSFGIWGSLWPVLNRAVMACIWYGVQSWIGGTCVYLMIRSIWPSWDNYGDDGARNTMAASSGTNTRDFVSFFLFWLGSLPLLWFPVHQIKHLFTVKAYLVPTAGASFFIWAIVRAGGVGPIVHQGATASGSTLAWAIVSGTMSAIANFATLIVNDPDFARFAARPKDALLPQFLSIPCGFAVTSFIGIIVTSSATVIFPNEDPIWSPLTLLTRFLEEPGVSGATRFGVFVIAAAFTLAQLGTNIAANSISAGTDLSALLPRWINIRRGSYFCALVGLVMCPWHLLKSSNSFTTYLSAYSVFLSSIAGVIIADYYFVRKGYLQVRDLYSNLRTGPYYYHHGVSWRAYTAYIAGILPNILGFADAVGAPNIPMGAIYVYRLNFFMGFIASSAVYYGLCRVWPIPATSDTWLEVDDEDQDATLVHGVEASDEENACGEACVKAKMDD